MKNFEPSFQGTCKAENWRHESFIIADLSTSVFYVLAVVKIWPKGDDSLKKCFLLK